MSGIQGRVGATGAVVGAVVLAVVLPVAAACSSGKSGATATGTVATSAASGTPLPRASVSGNRFLDPMGYEVDFPQAWSPYDNKVVAGPLITDIFFAPDTRDGVTPSIAVSCDTLPDHSVSVADFEREHHATLDGLHAIDYRAEFGRKVDGHDAARITYSLERVPAKLRKSEYMYVSGTCAWIAALTVPASDPPASDDILERFIASMKITK